MATDERPMDYALSDYGGIFGAPISPDDFKKLKAFRVAMAAAERRGIERAAKVCEEQSGAYWNTQVCLRMAAAIRALAQPAGASDREGT